MRRQLLEETEALMLACLNQTASNYGAFICSLNLSSFLLFLLLHSMCPIFKCAYEKI